MELTFYGEDTVYNNLSISSIIIMISFTKDIYKVLRVYKIWGWGRCYQKKMKGNDIQSESWLLIRNWAGEKRKGNKGSGRKRIFGPEGKTGVKALMWKWALDEEKQTVEYGEHRRVRVLPVYLGQFDVFYIPT